MTADARTNTQMVRVAHRPWTGEDNPCTAAEIMRQAIALRIGALHPTPGTTALGHVGVVQYFSDCKLNQKPVEICGYLRESSCICVDELPS
jgi:hypothetical protein